MNLPQETLLGYRITLLGQDKCVEEIAAWIGSGNRCRWLACINPHSYVEALKIAPFSVALHDSDWLVPDGIGIVLASRILNGRIKERVTGSDIFHSLHAELNRLGGAKVFLLGATESTLELVANRLKLEYPNIAIVGALSPPFKETFSESEDRAMVSTINFAAPDVLWVGLSAPKQEMWIHRNRTKLDVKFAGAVGAVFDFYAGRIHRASPVFQRAGLEWLPRLFQEPRRLWRRMFVSAPLFVKDVVSAKVKAKPEGVD
jgi:N-acetylglucosaminyldiphosphoundecaprenol N-acetyl-beta-D-mannosaminyltransferase